MSSRRSGDQIFRGVIGGAVGSCLAALTFIFLVRFSHNASGELVAIYSLTPVVFYRFFSVGVYLGLLLGVTEFIARHVRRGLSPLIYAAMGMIGLFRFYVADGFPAHTDLIYVFFTFPDDRGLGITCFILIWMIAMGLVRQFRRLTVFGGSMLESAATLIFIMRGMINRWPTENHYELFTSALCLWILLFTIVMCQRRNGGI